MRNKTNFQTGFNLCSLAAFFLTLGAAAPESVTLSEGKDSYHIEGVFEVQAERSQVWQVLTDYGALKGVVSSLAESAVLERKGDEVLVLQTMLGHFLFFSRSVNLKLHISESPQNSMVFEEISRKDFRLYCGSWKLDETPLGVQVHYELNVSSADMAPPFLEKSLFQDNALVLLKELKAEIIKRAAVQASGARRVKG